MPITPHQPPPHWNQTAHAYKKYKIQLDVTQKLKSQCPYGADKRRRCLTIEGRSQSEERRCRGG